MSMVAYDVINMGGSAAFNVLVFFHECSVLINGTRYYNSPVLLRQVSDIRLSSVSPTGYNEDDYDDDCAYCTWGDINSISIISGDKVNEHVGIINSVFNPLNLHVNDFTCIAITPKYANVTPAFMGMDDSVLSYIVGDGDEDVHLIEKSDLVGGYGYVQFVQKNTNYIHVYNVMPANGRDSVAIERYNYSNDVYYPNAEDSSIPVKSGYAYGQTVTGRDDSWYGRWISLYCTGAPQPIPNGSGGSSSSTYDSTFVPRLSAPDPNDRYYLKLAGSYEGSNPEWYEKIDYNYITGWNPAILGNYKTGLRPSRNSVLPNCVGYAVGRFNEIGAYEWCKYLTLKDGDGNPYGAPAAGQFINFFGGELEVSDTPSQGACIVWAKDGGSGHVAIVEDIYDDGSIEASMSNWSGASFTTEHLYIGDGNWRCGWMRDWGNYTFLGFLKHPDIHFNGNTNSNAINDSEFNYPTWRPTNYSNAEEAERLLRQRELTESGSPIVYRYEKEVVGTIQDIQGMKLLTTPTLVESPFIEVKIGDYTFGSFTKEGTSERIMAGDRVTYPNYMDSLKITKVNGAINQYVLSMNYQIQAGDDPNLIDKILSSVSDSRKITLTYGDWNSPSFVYRNEEALITKVTSNVDFQQSRIRYTLYCTSASVSLKSNTYSFGGYSNTKPSEVIKNLLINNTYGLLDIFYGMKNLGGSGESVIKPEALSMIPSDDKEVDIKPQSYVDILTYLNYLVSCMASNSSQEEMIKDSAYYLIIKDEVGGDLNGPYFKIVKVNTQSAAISSSNAYEVDIGFPDNSLVLNFQINDDNSWAILYKYAESANQEQYVYKIDDYGRLYTEKSPNVMMSNVYYETTEANKTWWTKMTQFPVSAVLTIKGLIRPSMLMDYVKINAVFYGQRHASSGLYVITKQEDTVDKQGYKTTLYLTRISGDEDELYSLKRTEVISPRTIRRDSSSDGKIGGGFNGGQAGSSDNSVVVDDYGLGNYSILTKKSAAEEHSNAFTDSDKHKYSIEDSSRTFDTSKYKNKL